MKKAPATVIPPGWKRVVFSAECDEAGNCPVCGDVDFAECPCPGPTQDDLYEYQEFGDALYAKLLPQSNRRRA